MSKELTPRLNALTEQYPDEDFLYPVGYDAALLGVAGGFDELRLVYSVRKIIEILIEQGDPSSDQEDYDPYTDAREYFDYNVAGGYVGPKTPIWVEDECLEEIDGQETKKSKATESALVASKEV